MGDEDRWGWGTEGTRVMAAACTSGLQSFPLELSRAAATGRLHQIHEHLDLTCFTGSIR